MLSDELRARIARLTASQLTASQPRSTEPQARAVPAQPQPSAASLPPALRVVSATPAVAPPELADAKVCENASGAHLRFCRPLSTWWPEAEQTARQLDPALGALAADTPAHPELAATRAHFPERTMFLDLETCGFAGAPIFLAGVVWRSGDALILDQLFARHYGEERALLETLWTIAGSQRVLATFNGKSFDWPMVRDRTTRHRLGSASGTRRAAHPHDTLTHCDLLHHARRRWKRVLPDCKLQTLERYVCRRVRHDDLPGSDVPAAYNRFVRTGESQPIRSILHHNALDLVTLVQLTLKLLDVRQATTSKLSEAG